MASNARMRRRNRNRRPSPDSNTADDADSTLSSTRSPRSAGGSSHFNQIDDAVLRNNIQYKRTMEMNTIHNQLRIRSPYDEHLLVLKDYEIVIVCDDSGSMNAKLKKTGRTRWEELCDTAKKVLRIAVTFDTNGVDIYFLNGETYPKVKDLDKVDCLFARKPSGYTPLVCVLTKIFQSQMAARGRDKKLLVVVATDGRPTDEDGDDDIDRFEHAMDKIRDAETTYVSFLLCTEDTKSMEYLEKIDGKMPNVDVTSDYYTELAKIRKCQENENFLFTKDDHIVKVLVGPIIPDIDNLNEHKV